MSDIAATRSGADAGESAVLVELTGITKAFPGVVANDNIDLTLHGGEVHCLLGENGAGKSTLIGILSGVVRPDAGTIAMAGRPVAISSPRRALELGIGTVYQHSALIPALSVIDNLMLGDGRGRLDVGHARQRLEELASGMGVEIDPDATAADLALGAQQQVEIIKALWRGSRVLILDEPTSMLTPQGFADLEQVVGRLKASGQAIVFITHKLHEALALGDRVSILRQGRLVGTIEPAELAAGSAEALRGSIVRMMFGDEARSIGDVAELREDVVEGEVVAAGPKDRPTALELTAASASGVGSERGIEDVSLQVRAGEILGIAGVDGNGQRALAEAVAGQRRLTSGDITLYGASIAKLSIARRQRLGLRYVTDDRLGEGTVPSLSVALNLFLKRIGQRPFWRFGRVQRSAVNRKATELVREFDVRTPSVQTRIGTLSGGNIQKVLLARELSFDPSVVVFHKPTYGLDVRTAAAVRSAIRRLAQAGGAVLLISTDLDELLEVCERIAVLSRGQLAGTVVNRAGAAEQIGELMVGSAAAVQRA